MMSKIMTHIHSSLRQLSLSLAEVLDFHVHRWNIVRSCELVPHGGLTWLVEIKGCTIDQCSSSSTESAIIFDNIAQGTLTITNTNIGGILTKTRLTYALQRGNGGGVWAHNDEAIRLENVEFGEEDIEPNWSSGSRDKQQHSSSLVFLPTITLEGLHMPRGNGHNKRGVVEMTSKRRVLSSDSDDPSTLTFQELTIDVSGLSFPTPGASPMAGKSVQSKFLSEQVNRKEPKYTNARQVQEAIKFLTEKEYRKNRVRFSCRSAFFYLPTQTELCEATKAHDMSRAYLQQATQKCPGDQRMRSTAEDIYKDDDTAMLMFTEANIIEEDTTVTETMSRVNGGSKLSTIAGQAMVAMCVVVLMTSTTSSVNTNQVSHFANMLSSILDMVLYSNFFMLRSQYTDTQLESMNVTFMPSTSLITRVFERRATTLGEGLDDVYQEASATNEFSTMEFGGIPIIIPSYNEVKLLSSSTKDSETPWNGLASCPALLCDHERTSGNSEQQSLVVQYIDIAVGVTSIFVQTINKLKRERREVFFQIATPLEQRRGAGFSEEELELNSERGQVNDDEKMIGKKNQDEEENEEDEDKKKNELKDGEKEETKSQKAKREAEEKKKAEEEEKKKKKKKDRNGLAPQQIDLLNKINKMSNFIPNSFYVRVVIGIILIVGGGVSSHPQKDHGSTADTSHPTWA
ncbi:hypothetical protein BLNAU_1910 [Blattamonas nauphoetae]|uniref:Uncharacterized protein n=1 Tax=Blattamonas nauphoetae TaxID=2049346 RepID=A0ABQ9YHY3_9EUKA|nr:hypothetical protein BLNAU_1910 [Blattamonas nauphoetae]